MIESPEVNPATVARLRSKWNKAGHVAPAVVGRRGIASASSGPLTRTFGGKWGSANSDLQFDIPTIRARSRQMADGPVITSFINAVINNVLGPTGINHQMKVKTSQFFGDRPNKKTGLWGEPDKQANDIIETLYKLACSSQNYLVSADMTKRGADELKLRGIIVDGESIVRTWKPYDNEVGIARQLIDPDFLDINLNVKTQADGRFIRMGKEYDQYGRCIAFYFLNEHPNDPQLRPFINSAAKPAQRHERVDAKEIRHSFIRLRPGQSRGVPVTSPALLSVRQLEAFIDASVVNARIGAARNVYYEKQFPTGWTAQDGVDALPTDTGAIIDDLKEGEALELPYGVTAKTLDTRFPDASIEPFTKSAMRLNSMGLGTSYMTLSNDLSEANFSSLRAGLNEERSLWARWQQFFIEEDCEPDFRDFLDFGLASQFIPLPPTKKKKFLAAQFTGRRWQSVNPLQDIQAHKEAISMLITSPQRVIRANGDDPEEILEEIEEFRNMASARNLNWSETPLADVGENEPMEEPDEPSAADAKAAASV